MPVWGRITHPLFARNPRCLCSDARTPSGDGLESMGVTIMVSVLATQSGIGCPGHLYPKGTRDTGVWLRQRYQWHRMANEAWKM